VRLVIAARVTQVDSTAERDVAVRLLQVPDDDQSLVVRPTDANPLVQEHLAAGPLDRLAEMAILLFVELGTCWV